MLTYAKKIIFLFLIPLCIVALNGCPSNLIYPKIRKKSDNISQDQGVANNNSSRSNRTQNPNKKVISIKKNNRVDGEKPKNNTHSGVDISPVKNNKSNQRDIDEEYNKAMDNEYEGKNDNQIIKTEKNKKWPWKIKRIFGEMVHQIAETISCKKIVKKNEEMNNGAAPAA